MTTRASILSRAFGRLAMGDYEFDVTPDERAQARDSLDTMLGEWAAIGVDLGHTPSDGDNDAEEMTTPSWSDQGVIANLALRMAADFGKTPGSGLTKDAKRGYDLATAKTLAIPTAQRAQSVAHGGGERYYRRFSY
jgi:hypothetical protein